MAALARPTSAGPFSAGEYGSEKMIRRSILASITGVALVTLVAAGCSDESSKSGTVAASLDACALLTAEDISAVFDRTFNADESGLSAGGGAKQGAMTSCAWTSPGPEVAGKPMASLKNTSFINLIAWSWPAGSNGGERYMKSMVDGDKALDQPVPAPVTLGDAALWGGKTMHVKKGDVTMSLTLTGPGEETAKRAAGESLMTTALGRL
jgi:hypothetical protein